jgi:hypothetical protein
VELLLFGLHIWIHLQLVLNYLSAYPHEIGGGPCENIAILVKELQKLRLLLWTHFGAEADGFIGYPGSSGTFLKSPSASIAFLNSIEASYLDEDCTCSCFSVSSLRKCTFL